MSMEVSCGASGTLLEIESEATRDRFRTSESSSMHETPTRNE
jgi:hypothetical protein